MLGTWPLGAGYGLIAKLRVVQPELEALPPGAASIELPQTWPVVPVAGAAGAGGAAAEAPHRHRPAVWVQSKPGSEAAGGAVGRGGGDGVGPVLGAALK